MMVKVWNDNVHPYKERFKGEKIDIPAKSFIKMDFNEAHQFMGTMPGNIELDANGDIKPECFKKLRIEKLTAEELAPVKFVCNKDGKEFLSQEALDAHIEANYTDMIVDEDSKEEFLAKRGKGRPRKGSVNDTSSNRNGGAA